ncbi:ABC transporter substrate-binding protein [bacterium]|nr:ABC transporter substrate-binding protein [bacterium]
MNRLNHMLLLGCVLGACLAGAYRARAGEAVAPGVPRRVISASPAITEMIYALGAEACLAGVADFSAYPPAARSLPRIGGAVNPNLEAIIALKPDLVLISGDQGRVRELCAARKIRVLRLDFDNWATITNALQRIGDVLGVASNAAAVRADMARRWDAARGRARTGKPVAVLLCAGRAPGAVASCMTANGSSFLSEALEAAGGSNVCADVRGFYPEIAAEAILARAPDAVFELRPGEMLPPPAVERIVRDWAPLRPVPAVKAGRIVILTNDCLLVPGPRIVEIAELFEHALRHMPALKRNP